MNQQKKFNKDGSVKSRGIEWTDYTSNPVAGCFHACRWQMPDGSVANCYAEDVAGGIAGKMYPDGFEHHYWNPGELNTWGRIPAKSKVFVGSMADVFGHWVPEVQIDAILKQAALRPDVVFQFLTKNPKRVLTFASDIPTNCWIGASTPPDFMWNKPLSIDQRERMLHATLGVLATLRNRGLVTWMSAEPITIDVGESLSSWERPIDWMVIGAASNGHKKYAPSQKYVENAVAAMRLIDGAIFFKGNMQSLKWAQENWREEYPKHAAIAETGQQELFDEATP